MIVGCLSVIKGYFKAANMCTKETVVELIKRGCTEEDESTAQKPATKDSCFDSPWCACLWL